MKLRHYLHQKKKTGTEFANTIGVEPSAVSNWLQGIRTPRPEIAKRIIAATNGAVTWDDLYADPVETQREAA